MRSKTVDGDATPTPMRSHGKACSDSPSSSGRSTEAATMRQLLGEVWSSFGKGDCPVIRRDFLEFIWNSYLAHGSTVLALTRSKLRYARRCATPDRAFCAAMSRALAERNLLPRDQL